ncbi:MAG TPA: hypothetical protein VGP64_17865 [Polyangia bacterium]
MVGFRLMLLALALAGAAPPAPPTGAPVLLWLGPFDTGAIDGPSLLEAVAVYTRDLNLETRTASDVPLPASAARAAGRDLAAGAALRAHGARLGFWCDPAPDGKTTTLLTVDTDGRLEARVVEAAGLDRAERNRAIALKLRAVLAATIGPEVLAPAAKTPASVAPPAEVTAVPPAPIATAPQPAPAPSPAAAAPVVIAKPLPLAGPSRFFGVVGYRLSAPIGAGSFQQGAAGELGARLGRSAELALGAALETHATDAAGGETVSVFDLPVDVGARFMLRGPRLSFGAGGFAALHFLSASAGAAATAGTAAMAGTSFDLGGSVGLVALVRGRLAGTVAAEARFSGELAVPGTTYTVGQTHTRLVELGPRVGLDLGLVFPAF